LSVEVVADAVISLDFIEQLKDGSRSKRVKALDIPSATNPTDRQ
jgi:hypothetical protein